MKTNSSPAPASRASFSSRLAAHALDLLACGVFTLGLPAHGATKYLAAIVWAYFFLWDFFAGRTPGKRLMGLQYVTTSDGPVGKSTLVLRSFYRLLGPVLILSWRRCSLLDALTGSRVVISPRQPSRTESRRVRAPVR